MAISKKVYFPNQFQFAIKPEVALGTALTTTMQLLNVDGPVWATTPIIQTLDPRSGGSGMVLAAADIHTSQLAQRSTITVPFIVDTAAATLTPLLENVIGAATSTSPASIDLAHNYTFTELAFEEAVATNLGTFSLACISPISAESVIIPGCACTAITLTMDMGTESGLMHANATFETGFRPAAGAAAPTGMTAYGTTHRYLTLLTTKKNIGGVDVILNKMELTFGNPLVTSGFQGTYGEPEIYQRANPKNFCTGVFGVKHDDNTANIWESWRAGTDVAVEISNNATFTEATFGFKAAMGRITGDLAPAGTDQGMYVDIPLEFAAGTSGDIFQYVP